MNHEADLLNELYDAKEDRRRLRQKIYREKNREGVSNFGVHMLERELEKLQEHIVKIRSKLWKGCGGEKRYSPNFSSSVGRTGRVLPRKSRP